MSDTYSLTFVNHSKNNWKFCCYQTDPNMSNPEIMSLAWFAFPVAPTTTVQFFWQIDYQFIWSQTGKLAPGVMFNASQKWDAGLKTENHVDFTRLPNKAFTFENQRTGPQSGTLYIHQDGTIPLDTAAVGINMTIKGSPSGAGSGTFVVPAQPNITASFTPHPQYWVTFGDFAPGQVLDVGQIVNSARVAFPPNVFDMYAVLDEANNWTIASQQTLNERFLASRQHLAHALVAPVKADR